MKAITRIGLVLASSLISVSTWSCAGPVAVSPDRLTAEESRHRGPFDQERAVVADQITIELSANFNDDVARPAINPELHSVTRDTDAGDAVTHWRSQGGIQLPLRFVIGRSTFVALQSAALRVRGSGKPLALTVVAKGHVTELAAGRQMQDCQELRIENGLVSRR